MSELAVQDLHEIIDTGLSRGGHLLSAGESAVLRVMRSLDGPAALAYARLSARVPDVFALDDLSVPGLDDASGAIAALVDAELADHLVPWSVRAAASTVPELAAACRRLGLPTTGRKAALVERLRERTGWSERRWVRIRHKALLRRLERWTFLRVGADRSTLVVERLGIVRWPDYEPTHGALHRDRRSLLAWEALLDQLDTLEPERCLEALETWTDWPPGGLDPRWRLRWRVYEAARERERAGESARARSLYERLRRVGDGGDESLTVRIARTHEHEGALDLAWAALHEARAAAGPVERVALSRAGRRLGRSTGRGWAPDPPLRRPDPRRVALAPGETSDARPRWRVDGAEHTIERAIAARLAGVGRSVVRGEGPLWTTLFTLLFREACFLPVPGMLPARRLSGPLDLGTPGFARRRREAVEAVLAAVARGEAPERIRRAHAGHEGEALAGVAWQLADGETLARVAEGFGSGLAVVLRRLLEEGWQAARGLPDLVVLPGDPVRLERAFPARLTGGALLVEVKGPTDAVRDEQAVWFDLLLRAGVPVELWTVERT